MKTNFGNAHDQSAMLRTLKDVLSAAKRGGYTVGPFSPRTIAMIQPVPRAVEVLSSPLIVQISKKEFAMIQEAIAVGFTSVMIAASETPLDENIYISREVVAYAHTHGVSVEAELGWIGTADFIETDRDEEQYTRPEEAERSVRETGVDALAVSVGTAHGVYTVRKPKIDLPRPRAIRVLTSVHLVLHGGSGIPAAMMQAAILLEDGGVRISPKIT